MNFPEQSPNSSSMLPCVAGKPSGLEEKLDKAGFFLPVDFVFKYLYTQYEQVHTSNSITDS